MKIENKELLNIIECVLIITVGLLYYILNGILESWSLCQFQVGCQNSYDPASRIHLKWKSLSLWIIAWTKLQVFSSLLLFLVPNFMCMSACVCVSVCVHVYTHFTLTCWNLVFTSGIYSYWPSLFHLLALNYSSNIINGYKDNSKQQMILCR